MCHWWIICLVNLSTCICWIFFFLLFYSNLNVYIIESFERGLQSWTTKALQIIISARSASRAEISSDSCSDCRNESKNTPLKTFPWCFRTANILGQKIATFLRGESQVWVVTVLLHIIKRLRTVENGIQMHHGHPWGTLKTFLLAYSPLCGLSSESHAVCQHPSPRAVDESSDYLDRTHVESIFGSKGHQPEKSSQSGSWEDGTWKGNVSNLKFDFGFGTIKL